jgi:methylglutaconyl-CoA hydratase
MTSGPNPPILRENLTDEIVLLTLNRPERCNAFSTSLLESLLGTLQEISFDISRRVLILRGAGTIFCGGLDLRLAATDENPERMATLVSRILIQIRQKMPQIMIAAVHGTACAGGAALTLVADFVIAAEGFKIGFPEVRRGLVPALLFPLLRRKLNDSALRRLLFTGLPLDVTSAKELGIVHAVVPAEELVTTAFDLAKMVCEGNPHAVRSAKYLLCRGDDDRFEQEMRDAVQVHLQSWRSPEAQEGIRAFLEKRPPQWSGVIR